MLIRSRLRRSLVLAVVLAAALPAGAARGTAADHHRTDPAAEGRLIPRNVTWAGHYGRTVHLRHDGVFEGRTSTGAFRVPYQITAPVEAGRGNGTVLVEPSHFSIGLGARDVYLRPRLLFSRGFAHAGIGWSTADFGPGQNLRVLDPRAPGVFVRGGTAEGGGRTDPEIVTEFARALSRDPVARRILGEAARKYVTGFSDSSVPVLDLVTSGRARGVFDLALPFTTEGADPQPALLAGRYDGRLVILNSEAEDSATLADRGVVPDRYRFYAVAGSPHVPDHLDISSFATRTTPAGWEPALRAHFLQADRWVRHGDAPPASYHLKTAGGVIARDATGNALAVDAHGRPVPRPPYVELGEARYVTGFVGSYDTVRSIGELGFTGHAGYLAAFRGKLLAQLAAGHITREEAAAMRARAALCPPLTYTQTYRDHYADFVAMRPCASA
ncbi:alpha/beta hydrolase domain-containing protein [Nonomuraea muscovyensis]|uniref:alpha/beta hydrolase domain-containing protein n=1 Tax=Nonomuraea muscovyensis TaxID=1124761 RepID=UPI00340AB182